MYLYIVKRQVNRYRWTKRDGERQVKITDKRDRLTKQLTEPDRQRQTDRDRWKVADEQRHVDCG
jgi:hypothetical protein